MSGTKRTRALIQPQSRGGCRSRKVKCDKARPSCKRCSRSNIACKGYKDDINRTSPAWPLDTFAEVHHLSQTASLALHSSGLTQHGQATAFWCFILPQLPSSDEASLYAAAAFGASLEGTRTKSIVSSQYYGEAVKQIQDCILRKSQPTLTVIAACLFLAFTDVLLHREQQALAHLEGTLTLVRLRQKKPRSITPCSDHSSAETGHALLLDDPLDYAAAAVDIVTSSYALGLNPRIPELSLSNTDSSHGDLSTLQSLEPFTLRTLHSAFKFARSATGWRYCPPGTQPPYLVDTQQHHVCQLQKCVDCLAALYFPIESTCSSRALVLSIQCISCLIYISAIREAYECAYDAFTARFRSIVEGCEFLRAKWKPQSSPPVPTFSPDLGIVQPLYLTACKCRHPDVRRRAIDLLRETGREGPFDGPLLAAVTQQAMLMEESFVPVSTIGMMTASVPEIHRFHGCGAEIAYDPETDTSETMAIFSRCRDVDEMLADTSALGYKDPRRWEIWQEPVAA